MNLEHLRDQLATAANAFVMALDRLINAGTTAATTPHPLLESIHGGSYSSVASIVNASTHLEHFHVYSKPALNATRGVETETSSLDWHVDAGLFLAFAPGHNCNGGIDASLYVDNSPVIFPPNTLAVMLGTGAEHWLQTGVALRATRHAVKMHPGDDRAWYGMSTCFAFRCDFLSHALFSTLIISISESFLISALGARKCHYSNGSKTHLSRDAPSPQH